MKHHRLKELLTALDVKPGSFEIKYLGESRAKNIYNWLDGEFKMKEDTVDKIIESVKKKRPDFNPAWFREGKGEMFGDYAGLEPESKEESLIREVETLRQKVSQLEGELHEIKRRENAHLVAIERMALVGKAKGVTNSPKFVILKGSRIVMLGKFRSVIYPN